MSPDVQLVLEALETQRQLLTDILITLQQVMATWTCSCGFVAGHSFDELARLQAVGPLMDANALAGGWPDDEEPDQALAEIYANRE